LLQNLYYSSWGGDLQEHIAVPTGSAHKLSKCTGPKPVPCRKKALSKIEAWRGVVNYYHQCNQDPRFSLEKLELNVNPKPVPVQERKLYQKLKLEGE
jgi:hypothetical protein